MDKKERFNKLVRFIVFNFDLPYTGTVKAIADKVGLNSSNLSTALNGNERFLTDSLVRKVNSAYGSPFRIEWLLRGTGEMYSKQSSPVGNETWVVQSQQETIARLTEAVERLSLLLKQQV